MSEQTNDPVLKGIQERIQAIKDTIQHDAYGINGLTNPLPEKNRLRDLRRRLDGLSDKIGTLLVLQQIERRMLEHQHDEEDE